MLTLKLTNRAFGFAHQAAFNPITVPCIALCFTLVDFGLSLWSAGTPPIPKKVPEFSEKNYAQSYLGHLGMIERHWSLVQPEVVEDLRRDMFSKLCSIAGIEALVEPTTATLYVSDEMRCHIQNELEAYTRRRNDIH
ncbi:hypothetical protein ABKN59_009690 [Abortiporus biennis]